MASEEISCTTFAELLERNYSLYRDRVAVSDARGSLTYGQVRDRARQIASELRRRGAKTGDRIVMVLNNRAEFVQIEHALALGGLVRVGVITRLHHSEVAHIIADADPFYAFIEADWLKNADPDFLSKVPCPVVIVGAEDAKDSQGHSTFESFLAEANAPQTWAPPRPEDHAWFMYTSGSTGTPKGVVHTQRSIMNMNIKILHVMKTLCADDIALHTAPLPHFSGAIGHAVFIVGGQNIFLDGFQPSELFEMVAKHRVTVLPVVPTQLNILADHLRQSPSDISSVRIVPYAGSAIAPDRLALATEFFGPALVQYYGSSEVPMPITALYPEDHVDTKNELGLPRFAAAGRAAEGVDISIRDADNKPVPAGTPGEIVARSTSCSSGYWRNEEATKEILEPDGFMHTGDIGVLDNSGFLFIVDRKKDMIVTGGFNVFPREVENAISLMPEVSEVAVVSAPDEKWGETIVAVVVAKPGVTLSFEQVQAHCRKHLAGYKVPKKLTLVDALPKGSTGKLQKKVLKEQFWANKQRKVGG